MDSSQNSSNMKDNKFFNLEQLINLNNLYSKISYSMEKQGNNDKGHEKKVFLIMGTTTSGKTVIQYYLCQDSLIYGIEENKRLPFIIPQNTYQNAIVEKTPNTITTHIPNIRQIPDEQVLIIEIPDIKQLKHEEQSIEYLFLQRIFKQMTKLHIIVVIEEMSLQDLEEIMKSFQCVTQLFEIKDQNARDLVTQGMSIVVNKVSEDSEDSDVKGNLEQFNDELIAQESQQLSQLIASVIKQDRVYLIKNIQPQANQQKELLSILLQNSKFMQFSSLKLLGNHLQQINIVTEQVAKAMINKLRVRQLWESGVNKFYKLIRFLTDPKIWAQKNQENSELIQQVRSMMQAGWQQLQQQYLGEERNAGQIQGELIGKKLSSRILKVLEKLIKGINNNKQQDECRVLYEYTIDVVELLKELRVEIRNQLLITITQIQKKQNIDKLIDYCYSILSLRQLLNRTTHLETILDYIIQILNYKSEENQQPQDSQQQFHQPCLVLLTHQLIGKIKYTFTNFDLSWLKTKSKNKTKSPKKIKREVIKKPNLTIQQLKKQFLNQINQNKYSNLINQIINLPLSHFKLYLLIDQFKRLNNEINQNQSKFLQLSIVIKQIALILHSYQFYVEEIKFLVVIPDWNRILIAIESMQKLQKANKENKRIEKKDIHFLNQVGIYAQRFLLKKAADRIFSLVDNLITQQIQNGNISKDESQRYFNQRQDQKNLYDNWQMAYLQQQYRQQPQSSSPLWKIIEKAKRYEQLHSERITRFNQQILLMKQRLV